MTPRYDSTRDVTRKYLRRMLNVPPVYAIKRQLRRDTKPYQEEIQNGDETRQTSWSTSDIEYCRVLIFCLACICLLIRIV